MIMKKKCWLVLLLASLALNAWATDRKITVTFTPDMPLTPVNAEFICTSMYSRLTSAATQKLSIQTDMPFSCGLSSDNKQIVMIFHIVQE